MTPTTTNPRPSAPTKKASRPATGPSSEGPSSLQRLVDRSRDALRRSPRPGSTGARTTGSTGSGASRSRRPGTPIDPRIKERRVAVTRRQGRRRLMILLVALAVAALVVGGWLLLHSSLFSAKVVTVKGSTHATATQVIDAGGLDDHPALLGLDPGAVAARIEALPWVASATVSRSWPDGVVVTVVERTPAAAVARSGGGWALIDRTGRVLADVATPPTDVVHLSVPTEPGAPGTTLAPADGDGLAVAASLPAAFAAQVAAVNVVAGGGVQLVLTTPLTVQLGNATQLHAKYEDIASLLAGAALHAGDVIDVSVPESPTVTSS